MERVQVAEARLADTVVQSPIYIDPHCDEFLQDPFPTYKILQLLDPVYYWERGKAWLITRYADVASIQFDPRFSSRYTDAASVNLSDQQKQVWQVLEKNDLHKLGGADNDRLRAAVLSYFDGVGSDFLRSLVLEISNQKLFRIAYLKHFDVVSDFAHGVSSRVLTRLFAIPERQLPAFMRFTQAYVGLLDPKMSCTPDQLQRRIGDLTAGLDLIRETIQIRRAAGSGPHLIDHLIDLRYEGNTLSDAELVSLIAILAGEGLDTARLLISNAIFHLLEHNLVPALKAAPDMWPAAIKEVLRFDFPLKLGTPRYALMDIWLGESRISRGDMVYPVVAAAHRDPLVFSRPDDFDMHRPTEYILSGALSTHTFIGMNLALIEAEVAVKRFFEVLPGLSRSESVSYDTEHKTLRAMNSFKLTRAGGARRPL